MSKEDSLKKAFNKFIGKEIPVNSRTQKIGDQDYTIHEMDRTHPVLNEMRKTASDMGLIMRVLGPGITGTMDYRTDRVNAYVKKDTDGKWKVSNCFQIG